MTDTVGNSEFLQLEAAAIDIFTFGPDDAFRAQVAAGAHHVDNIPAGIAVLPLTAIGIIKVAVKGVARHLIIEAQ